MESDFWQQAWKAGRIGFHQGEVNEYLEAHYPHLGSNKRVLVPLCGKAVDLTYLAAWGHTVIGVELVEQAVQEFFEQLGGSPRVTQQGPFKRYEQGTISILSGDFFATTKEHLGPVDALWDRASIVALPEDLRAAYMKHLHALMPQGAPGLVVTVEYPPDVLSGPPFSVTETELRAHYAGRPVQKLAEQKAKGSPRLLEVAATEKCFAVTF